MKDIVFSMPEPHNDDSLININKAQKKSALSSISNIQGALSFLTECLKSNDCKVSNRYNLLYVCNSHLEELEKVIGYDQDKKKEREHSNKVVRILNDEIAALKKQLSEKFPVEGLGLKLYECSKKFSDFWGELGFSKYLRDSHFAAHSSHNQFFVGGLSFMLSDETLYSENPRNFEDLVSRLKIDLTLESSGKNSYNVADTEKNKSWVIKTLQSKFPSLKIQKWESILWNNDKYVLRYADFHVDITDLL